MTLQELSSAIVSWMEDRSNNALSPGSPLPAFATPLVGCASGADALFPFLKQDIGPDFYWLPQEAFALAFGMDVPAETLRVISWVLPQTENTRKAHRRGTDFPSIEWSQARFYGEKVNEGLRRFVVEKLAEHGYKACAPALLPEWERAVSEKYGFASRWSERHAAHVCGLGTFGLSDGLITPAGKAIRVGSVVVQAGFTPTSRPYTHHNEWCLSHATGKCNACIKRCPANAISPEGHDKQACKAYIRTITAVHVEQEQLGFRVNSCGLCQTKVPCENRNPTAKISKR